MAFNIGGVTTAYINQIDPTLFTLAVGESTTAKDLIAAGSVVFGKGRVPIRKMDLDANFQSGLDACARNASGNITLTDTYMDIVRFKDEKDLCFQSLENTYFSLLAKQSIQPSEEGATPEFANEIIKLRVAKIAEANEQALWISNTGVTQSGTVAGIAYGSDYANFNKIDGIVKQVSSTYSTMTATGSDIVAKLRSAVLSLPVKIYTASDFRLAIGQDLYNQYVAAIASLNIYNEKSLDMIFGTTVKFWVVPGLNGLNKVYGIRLSNLRLGMANQDDADRVDIEYIKTNLFHGWASDVYWSMGVKVINTAEVGYLAYS